MPVSIPSDSISDAFLKSAVVGHKKQAEAGMCPNYQGYSDHCILSAALHTCAKPVAIKERRGGWKSRAHEKTELEAGHNRVTSCKENGASEDERKTKRREENVRESRQPVTCNCLFATSGVPVGPQAKARGKKERPRWISMRPWLKVEGCYGRR